jgi:hypothetical protein
LAFDHSSLIAAGDFEVWVLFGLSVGTASVREDIFGFIVKGGVEYFFVVFLI